ncbi:hypothetical protein HK096_000203 [Nowakowskiella sp. JEL0078]|nr:hypothetical protein HK096_000203 [Nowakowskiella sp. JEL0078]
MQVICEEVIGQELFDDEPESTRKHLMTYDTNNPQTAYIVYSFLYYLGMSAPNVLRRLVRDDYLEIVFDVVYKKSDQRCHHIAVKLLYELCKIDDLSLSDLTYITVDLVSFVLSLIEKLSGDYYEVYNYNLIRLLLIYNEQFRKKNIRTSVIKNSILIAIESRIFNLKTFTENLLFMFNRAGKPEIYNSDINKTYLQQDDQYTQILISRFLAEIFSNPRTCMLFYTNDLAIIVDVIVRELQIVDQHEDELQLAYLQIFPSLFAFTPLLPRSNNSSPGSNISLSLPISSKSLDFRTYSPVANFEHQKQRECEILLDSIRKNLSVIGARETVRKAAEKALEAFNANK